MFDKQIIEYNPENKCIRYCYKNKNGQYHGLLKNINKYGIILIECSYKNGLPYGVMKRPVLESDKFLYFLDTFININRTQHGIKIRFIK